PDLLHQRVPQIEGALFRVQDVEACRSGRIALGPLRFDHRWTMLAAPMISVLLVTARPGALSEDGGLLVGTNPRAALRHSAPPFAFSSRRRRTSSSKHFHSVSVRGRPSSTFRA